MSFITIATCLLPGLLVAQVAEDSEPPALVQTICANSKSGLDPTPTLEAIRVLTTSTEPMPDTSVDNLLGVVTDPGANTLVRVGALGLICKRSKPEKAGVIMDTVRSLFESISKPDDRRKKRYYSVPALLHAFLKHGVKPLSQRLNDQTALLELISDIAEEDTLGKGHIQVACFSRIADNPASLPVRQVYMLRLVESMPDDRAPQVFIGLVNDAVVERLRKIAFDGPVGTRGYHTAAVELLAEYGDRETAVNLRKWAKTHGLDNAAIERAGSYVWMIESQHNHQLLLDHIASDEWINNQTRAWALGRAMKLGLDKAAIRKALLAHAQYAKNDERLEANLPHLKKLALDGSVLSASDLPNVKAAKIQPTE